MKMKEKEFLMILLCWIFLVAHWDWGLSFECIARLSDAWNGKIKFWCKKIKKIIKSLRRQKVLSKGSFRNCSNHRNPCLWTNSNARPNVKVLTGQKSFDNGSRSFLFVKLSRHSSKPEISHSDVFISLLICKCHRLTVRLEVIDWMELIKSKSTRECSEI